MDTMYVPHGLPPAMTFVGDLCVPVIVTFSIPKREFPALTFVGWDPKPEMLLWHTVSPRPHELVAIL